MTMAYYTVPTALSQRSPCRIDSGDCTKTLMIRAEEAVVALVHDLQHAQEFDIPAEQLEAAQDLQRKAQWRLDFVAAENSMGFHAPQEAARILGEAIDYAWCGQLEMAKLQSASH